jgi:hypothetical protein
MKAMPYCDRCGQEIEFRYVHGRLAPIHLSGGCGADYVERDHYRSYASDSRCWSTNCPKCQSPVFFVRHNGGNVWVDPPLGWPWWKHGCFDDHSGGASRKSIAEESYLGSHPVDDILLGVVTKIEVHPHGRETILHIQLLDGKEMQVTVSGVAEIAGEMVIVDLKRSQVRFLQGNGTFQII